MGNGFAWIVRHPKTSVGLLLIALALWIPNLDHLRLNAEMEQFLPVNDPGTLYYQNSFSKTFGSDVLSVVIIKSRTGDVFTPATLSLIENYSQAIAALEHVVRVSSLTTVHMVKGEGDTINTGKLIRTIPTDFPELLEIKQIALQHETYVGYLISQDAKSAAINIYTQKPADDPSFEAKFVDQLEGIIETHPQTVDVYHVGTPRANATFLANIKRDQITINLAAILIIALFLFFTYASYIAILLPLVTTTLTMIAAFGFLAWMNYPITPYTALLPGLILVIGSTEDMHMLSLYFQNLRSGMDRRAAVMDMARHSALPVTLTAFTTIVGFGTLALNPTQIIKQFGISMAMALAINYLVTIVLVPALLQMLKKPAIGPNGISGKNRVAARRTFLPALLDRIFRITQHHERAIILIVCLMITGALAGLGRISVNNDYMAFFKSDSQLKKDILRLGDDLSGFNTINIVFEIDNDGDILLPQILEKIDGLQNRIRTSGSFDKSISIADHVKRLHREFFNGDPSPSRLPPSKEAVAQYLLLMDGDTVSEYLDSERKMTCLRIIHQISSSQALESALEPLQDYIATNLQNYEIDSLVHPIRVTFTGLDYLIKNSGDAIVRGQFRSLGLALLIIFILMSLIFLSFKGGLIAIVSNSIPILFNFGIMAWMEIPLDTTTCMVALVALGIAIDDTIHFMVRYQRELRITGNPKEAIRCSILNEGEPVMLTSIALALGFGTMMLSSFVPSIYFGLLSALVMISAMLTDLFVNPVLLTTTQLLIKPRFLSGSRH